MKKIIYTKYANERDPRFAVRTDIVSEDGCCYVEKTSLNDAANAHLEHTYQAYQALQELCRDSSYRVAACEKTESGIRFAYIEGETMEERLDQKLHAGETEEVEQELLTYCREIAAIFGKKPFVKTEEFTKLFGEVDIPADQLCADVNNIDMLVGNIMISGDGNYVIDYEWSFFCPVPVRFLVYRILHYYICANDLRADLKDRGLYEKAGISAAEQELYAGMEQQFQAYIRGAHVPLRMMYDAITPGCYPVMDWCRKAEDAEKNNLLQILYSYGTGYVEDPQDYYPMKDGEIELTLTLPDGVTNVRIDPGPDPTICQVRQLEFGLADGSVLPTEYHTPGLRYGEDFIAFDEPDPQFTVDEIPSEAKTLHLSIKIIQSEQEILHCFVQEKKKEENGQPPAAPEENTTSKQVELYGSIDAEKIDGIHERSYLVIGWTGTDTKERPVITVELDGIPQDDYTIEEINRDDVKSAIPEMKEYPWNPGFAIRIPAIADWCSSHREMKIYVSAEGSRKELFAKDLKELQTQIAKEIILYKMDKLTKSGDEIVLRGWAIASEGDHTCRVTIATDGEEPLDVSVQRMNRKDVAEAYKIETDCKCGFEAHFPRKLITGSRMEIRFSGAQETEIHEVDMKRFDRETSSWGRVMDLLAPAHARDNVRYIRENSLGAFASLIKQEYHAGEEPYDRWRREHALTGREIKRQRQTEFAYRPLISISIPVYNTPLPYLKELLESILGQTYDNWELCLADGSTNDAVQQYLQENYRDTRIRYKRLEKNEGIAGNTNQALAMASGEFIMLTDHDDTLTVNALYEMVKALNEDPDTDIIYTDEDLVDAAGKTYSSPRFKPDFNYEFLRSINYICHIFMVRKSIMEEVGGFRAEYDGAQDYDMILRCCEKTTRIRHIPMVLYHWRAHPDSTAGNPESKMYAVDASVRALKEHYHRLGIEAEVKPTDIFIMLHTIRKVSGSPKISIIIPNKDHIEDLDLCISSIRDRSSYSNYEIIVVENNSTDPETFAYYDRLTAEDARIQVVTWTQEFNYSKINNFGAQYATGDYYILLNNDIEVISPDWMEGMLGYCQEPGTGAVGAKLYYPDDTVQHCGIVIGVGGFGGHILTGSSSKDTGYFGKLKAVQEVSAVTAACMMVKREVFEQVGGFDEDFAVALNDVDLCMKIRDVGEKIILNPWVEMYHYESKSRGFEDTPEKIARFKKEIRRFRNKWKIELEKGDPYYNPNLTLDRGDCSIRRADERFEIIEEIEAEDANERTI